MNGNFLDSSGNGNNGSIFTGSPTSISDGVSGGAYHFDGDDGINVGNLDFSGGQFTINLWVRTTTPSDNNDTKMAISKANIPSGDMTFEIAGNLPEGFGMGFLVWLGGSTQVNLPAAIDVQDGQWHLVTTTYTAGAQQIFIDGCLRNSSTTAGPPPLVPDPVVIGGINGFGPYHHPWIGDLDEVSIYTRVLDAAEIRSLYELYRPITGCYAPGTMGQALGFALLAWSEEGAIDIGVGNASSVKRTQISGGEIGASGHIVLGNNGKFDGDAISEAGTITLNNNAKVAGKCVTDSSTVSLGAGAKCGSIDNSGTNPLLGLLSQAEDDSLRFACDVVGGSATSMLGNVIVAASKKFTITDTVPAGLNLIDLSSLKLGNSSTLTIQGGATDTVVLRVNHDTSIGHSAKIVLGGGLTPSQVVIVNLEGISFWGNSTTVSGTIFDTHGSDCVAGSGTTINGALMSSHHLTIGPNVGVNFVPAVQVSVPKVCY